MNGKLEKEIFNYSYDNQFELVSKAKLKSVARDSRGQVVTLGGLEFGYHHLNLIQMKNGNQSITNYYGENNYFFGSCDNSKNCFFKLSPNEVELNGELQKLIEVSGVPVGVLYKGNFYPAIIDHRMAVIGLLNTDGSAIKFLRHQDSWGNLEKVTGDRAFEKLVAFGYARLLQNPLVEQTSKTKLYFSGTRVYSPAMGEWMSPDTTVVWNPEKLINNPGNWDPFKYANNDPLNFLDVDGRFVQLGSALIGGAIGVATGYINAKATGGNVRSGIAIGFVTGAFIGSGAGIVSAIPGVIAQQTAASALGFFSSAISQYLVNGKVKVNDAIVIGVITPFGLTYSKLFRINGLAKLVGEAISGMSFMSVDLLAGFVNQKLKLGNNTSSKTVGFTFGDFNLTSSFGQ